MSVYLTVLIKDTLCTCLLLRQLNILFVNISDSLTALPGWSKSMIGSSNRPWVFEIIVLC